jgi:hypothetical protein
MQGVTQLLRHPPDENRGREAALVLR